MAANHDERRYPEPQRFDVPVGRDLLSRRLTYRDVEFPVNPELLKKIAKETGADAVYPTLDEFDADLRGVLISICVVLLLNPLLRRVRPQCRLSGRELGVICALVLTACGVPGRFVQCLPKQQAGRSVVVVDAEGDARLAAHRDEAPGLDHAMPEQQPNHPPSEPAHGHRLSRGVLSPRAGGARHVCPASLTRSERDFVIHVVAAAARERVVAVPAVKGVVAAPRRGYD